MSVCVCRQMKSETDRQAVGDSGGTESETCTWDVEMDLHLIRRVPGARKSLPLDPSQDEAKASQQQNNSHY